MLGILTKQKIPLVEHVQPLQGKNGQAGPAAVMGGQQPLRYSIMAAGIHILVLLWTLPLPISYQKDPSARPR